MDHSSLLKQARLLADTVMKELRTPVFVPSNYTACVGMIDDLAKIVEQQDAIQAESAAACVV